ncbi:hypothetical protein BJ878DRAFT_549805 [Calycina marina]|uniref:Uncharacterized protein n=1 Tax=Calycina marina TaxID=1763456 RepID=A0A9P8CF14_9HELO|nr:hypothetical protein BJ878DRAFT_549805 [Calycina marina]
MANHEKRKKNDQNKNNSQQNGYKERPCKHCGGTHTDKYDKNQNNQQQGGQNPPCKHFNQNNPKHTPEQCNKNANKQGDGKKTNCFKRDVEYLYLSGQPCLDKGNNNQLVGENGGAQPTGGFHRCGEWHYESQCEAHEKRRTTKSKRTPNCEVYKQEPHALEAGPIIVAGYEKLGYGVVPELLYKISEDAVMNSTEKVRLVQ